MCEGQGLSWGGAQQEPGGLHNPNPTGGTQLLEEQSRAASDGKRSGSCRLGFMGKKVGLALKFEDCYPVPRFTPSP